MKQKRFIFFWLPYSVKYDPYTFLTAFYLSLHRWEKHNAIHIGPPNLFDIPTGIPADWLNCYNCPLPDKKQIEELEKQIIDPNIFRDLQETFFSNNLVWRYLLTERHHGLEDELDKIIYRLIEKAEIEGIIA